MKLNIFFKFVSHKLNNVYTIATIISSNEYRNIFVAIVTITSIINGVIKKKKYYDKWIIVRTYLLISDNKT